MTAATPNDRNLTTEPKHVLSKINELINESHQYLGLKDVKQATQCLAAAAELAP